MKTFKIGNKDIVVNVHIDEVINYNEEYGFTSDDEEYNPYWVGINVQVNIGEQTEYGQVQYDTSSYWGRMNGWSLSCDGNTFKDNVKEKLLLNFSEEELYTSVETPNYISTIESDLHCDIINVHLDEIVDYIIEIATENLDF